MSDNYFSAIAAEWTEIARSDLESAEFLTQKVPMPLEIICYHCEQSAEKMLKGFLAFHGAEIPRIHALGKLCELCSQIDPEIDAISAQALELTPYGVNVRYPFHVELLEQDAMIAIKHATYIFDFIEPRIIC